jgi:hypothetical protein
VRDLRVENGSQNLLRDVCMRFAECLSRNSFPASPRAREPASPRAREPRGASRERASREARAASAQHVPSLRRPLCAADIRCPVSPRSHQPLAFSGSGRKVTVVAEDLTIVKDLCTYTIVILRQDKRLRDHAPTRRIRWARCNVSAPRWTWDESGRLRNRRRPLAVGGVDVTHWRRGRRWRRGQVRGGGSRGRWRGDRCGWEAGGGATVRRRECSPAGGHQAPSLPRIGLIR